MNVGKLDATFNFSITLFDFIMGNHDHVDKKQSEEEKEITGICDLMIVNVGSHKV